MPIINTNPGWASEATSPQRQREPTAFIGPTVVSSVPDRRGKQERVGVSVFEVAIGYAREQGKFRVQVVDSPVGHASTDVALDAAALLARRPDFENTLLLSSLTTRRNPSHAEKIVLDVGKALFTALLGTGEVGGRYRAVAAVADERGEELRIVLRIDAPELAALPWEAMFDEDAGGYVCRQHQLVRHVPVAAGVPPLTVQLPLRVLGVISAPTDLPPLNAGRERDLLASALSEPVKSGLVEVAWAASATWGGIHDQLMAGPWHVIHFIGHGDFDPDRDEGLLALTTDDGTANLVEASRFSDLLRQAKPMPRLIVLNSCQGGAASPSDPFAGTAASLTRSGVPAVVAMQYSVSDNAAIAFARGFYSALARTRGIDEAVSSGRVGILGTSGQTLEWLTPVLYLRGPENRLFTVTSARPVAREPQPVPAASQSAVATAAAAEPFRTLVGHDGAVCRVLFSPDGTRLATAGADMTIRLWHLGADDPPRILESDYKGHDLPKLAFSLDSETLIAEQDTSVRCWDTYQTYMYEVRDRESGTYSSTGIQDFEFCLNGKVAVAMWNEIRLRSHIESKGTRFQADGAVATMAISADGTLIAGASSRGVAIWNTDSVPRFKGRARKPDRYLGPSGQLADLAFSPDGSLIAAAGLDTTVKIWNPRTGDLRHTLSGHGGPVRQVVFSPDGALLATASNDLAVRLWEPDSGELLRVLKDRITNGSEIVFSRDGSLLATANKNTALLWNPQTGERASVMAGHTATVRWVAFGPDDSFLASASDDGTVMIWEIEGAPRQ
jgi:WD40 repeat protein